MNCAQHFLHPVLATCAFFFPPFTSARPPPAPSPVSAHAIAHSITHYTVPTCASHINFSREHLWWLLEPVPGCESVLCRLPQVRLHLVLRGPRAALVANAATKPTGPVIF